MKIKILVILVVLLSTGMLLVDVVVTVFWQRDVIHRERRHISDLLTMLAVVVVSPLAEDDSANDAILGRVVQELRWTGVECGYLLLGSRTDPLPQLGQCSLDAVAETAHQSLLSGREQYRDAGGSFPLFADDQRRLLVAVPIREGERLVGSVAVSIPFSSILSPVYRYQRIVMVSLLVNVIVLSVVGLFRFVRSTIRPLENLVTLTDSYTEEGSIPFFVPGEGDEFGQLSRALNRMLERIEGDKKKLRSTVVSLENANLELQNTQQEMIKAEKLASVGRLAAGMAHEIGNPLGIVQGYLGLLKIRDLPPEEWLDYVDRAEQELQRVNTLIRQLLDYSRVPSLQQLEVSLHDILSSLVGMVEQQPFMDNVDVRISCSAASDRVVGNPDQLRQVFLNCLMNSADAIAAAGREKGRVTIRTRNEFLQESGAGAEQVVIAITDNGEGIREEDLANVLDPFFTTKDPGKGTGLGLSVSHSIIAAHGGSMVVRSTYGQETTVEIRLPLSPE